MGKLPSTSDGISADCYELRSDWGGRDLASFEQTHDAFPLGLAYRRDGQTIAFLQYPHVAELWLLKQFGARWSFPSK